MGSGFARLACGTNRRVFAAVPWAMAGRARWVVPIVASEALPASRFLRRMPASLCHQVLLNLWVVVRVVPVFLPRGIADRRPARRIVRAGAGRQALDHPVELRSQEERNCVAMPSCRRQCAMRRGLE